MIKYYFSVISNFSFRGRARRSEFWWFLVFNLMVGKVLDFAGEIFQLQFAVPDERPLSIPQLVYTLAVAIQHFAVSARRFHDRGVSAWWLLPLFVAGVIGSMFSSLALIAVVPAVVIWALPGTVGDNKYGPDPKAEVADN
jgi:uncharacterized membrane protein YhaH (DUF805 family)